MYQLPEVCWNFSGVVFSLPAGVVALPGEVVGAGVVTMPLAVGPFICTFARLLEEMNIGNLSKTSFIEKPLNWLPI